MGGKNSVEEGEIPPSVPFPSQRPLPQSPGVTPPGWSSSAGEGGQFSPPCPFVNTRHHATCTAQVHHCGEGAVAMQGAETCLHRSALRARLRRALLAERCAEHRVCWPRMVPVAGPPRCAACRKEPSPSGPLVQSGYSAQSLGNYPSPSLAGPSLEGEREMWRNSAVQPKLPGRQWPE